MSFGGYKHIDEHKSGTDSKALISSHIRNEKVSDISFTSDRKGDPQNLSYGSLDRYKVPKYRTAGYSRLVGLERRFRIASSSDTKRDIQDDSNDATRKKHVVLSLVTSKIIDDDVPIVHRPLGIEDAFEFVDQKDFVKLSLKNDRKRRILSILSTKGEQDFSTPDDLEASDKDTASDSDYDTRISDLQHGDAFEQFRNHPHNLKQIELTRLTERNPQDIDAWLELVEHQDKFFLLSAPNKEGNLSVSAQRTVADIRISLYERALTKVTESLGREKLLLGLLQEGSKIWDTNKQLNQWKAILRQTPSIDLRYRYLDFRQSNVIVFSYDQCLETYSEILSKVGELNHEDDFDFHFCYLILRLTTFMHQSGHSERAIAIWQSLIELNFFKVSSVTEQSAVSAFEQFWDSEAARIGEANAKGWNKRDEDTVKPRPDDPLPTIEEYDTFHIWSKEEVARSAKDVMPARTLDETIEDDPYRVIISSDMNGFLTIMKSEFGQKYLLQAFLKFCGLPSLEFAVGRCRMWWQDPFLCDYESLALSSEFSGTDITKNKLSHFLIDVSTLFARTDWFSVWKHIEGLDTSLVRFASRALTQLVESRSEDDQLAVYLVALKFSRDQISGRKYAKGLLKKRQNSLLLYNVYALVEARSGNFESAKNVWSTALSMASSFGSDAQSQTISLWHSLVLELVHQKEYSHAVKILMTSALGSNVTTDFLTDTGSIDTYTPGDHLKAYAFYRNQIAGALSRGDIAATDAYTDLLAILRYYNTDRNLDEAISIYETTLTALHKDNDIILVERIHQSRARLIHTHASISTTGYKPMQLVHPLKQSRNLFPENTIFHNLHEYYSRRAGLIDRLRNLQESPATNSNNSNPKSKVSMIPSLLRINQELSRPSYAGRTTHSVRSAFTKATSPSSGGTTPNPQVWLDWLRWELSIISPTSSSLTSVPLPSQTTKRLKEIYLNSLRACPWSKDLYLFGFTNDIMRDIIGDRGRKEVYHSMVERGLRIRFDIGDLIEDA